MPQTETRGRSRAEWIGLAISTLIIVTVVALVLFQGFTQRSEPAVIEVRPQLQQVRHASDAYYLPLEISNTGGQTAEEVVVEVELAPTRGERERANVTVRFLAGGGTHHAIAIFRADPTQGTLTVTPRSILEP